MIENRYFHALEKEVRTMPVTTGLCHKCQVCSINIDPNNKSAYENYRHSNIKECLSVALKGLDYMRDNFNEVVSYLTAHHGTNFMVPECEICKEARLKFEAEKGVQKS